MAEIRLVDVSLRDGNQSLWGATGFTTAQVLAVAPWLDRVGFRALDFTSSTAMGVAVRVQREDPWERIRLAKRAMPNTPLQLIGTGFRFISWERAHPEVMRLVYERLVACGISRFVVLDPTHDLEAMLASAGMVRQAGGAETMAALTFTVSALHDDAFYADLAGKLAEAPEIDRFYVKDPSGLLTPERARTLLPAVRARLRGKPLELHSHCTLGLPGRSYLAAAELGVEVLHVACGPLAEGTSLPDAERTVANLRELGHTVDLDDRLLTLVAGYFAALARAEGRPAGAPRAYDAAFLRHQVPGGVMTTIRRQLAELGLQDRFGAVTEEIGRVRAELGHPIMVTPFPQMVASQALANVLGPRGERYANVPDQVIRYLLGRFGRPTGKVDPEVEDRILSRPRARQLAAEPPPPTVAELRARFGRSVSDEELLLRAAMPPQQVDAMLAAGPARRHYNPEAAPLLHLLRGLRARGSGGLKSEALTTASGDPGQPSGRPPVDQPPLEELVVAKPGLRIELRRRPRPTGGGHG
jgi:oxaloacetate decarboxylase alpha subunit